MKKLLLLLPLLLVLVLAACGRPPAHPLQLLGDAESFTFTAREYDVAAVIQPRAEAFTLLAIAHDGFAVQLNGDELDGVQLIYRDGWHLRSAYHPPPANVDNIAQLVVISTSPDSYAVRLIDGERAVQEITAGQLHLLNQQRVLHEHGTSQANQRSATVFTTQYRVPLGDLLTGSNFVAMSRSGETMFFRGQAYLLNNGNAIDLLLPDGRVLQNLVGVMAEPPGFLITEAFRDAMHFLQQGEQVLLIKLDGLGWDMLDYAPFIRSLEPRPALAVFPPITPTGLASILTGETPNVHGIQRRGQRELAVDDIFTLVPNSVHIGARNSFINTSLPPQLTLSDADAFMLARQAMDDAPDLLFIHFKEIDVTAHAYGPHAEQTQQVIAEIDGFVRVLVEHFNGRVILTSDHGLHDTHDGGNHGLFLSQDMIVPYVVR